MPVGTGEHRNEIDIISVIAAGYPAGSRERAITAAAQVERGAEAGIPPAAGIDADHAACRTAAVERALRPLEHLDAADRAGGKLERTEEGVVIAFYGPGFAQGDAVETNLGVAGFGAAYHKGVHACRALRIAHEDAGLCLQGVHEGAALPGFHVFRRDDAHAGSRFGSGALDLVRRNNNVVHAHIGGKGGRMSEQAAQGGDTEKFPHQSSPLMNTVEGIPAGAARFGGA